LYGRRLTLRPLRKLREEEKFTGMRELQSAIAADVAQTEKWWRENETAAAAPFPAG
ncbi:MAG: riboflavin kinase, partial [Gammaproteobacteria bacterium]